MYNMLFLNLMASLFALDCSCSAGEYVVCSNAGKELCGNEYDDDCDGQADEAEECNCDTIDEIRNINDPDPEEKIYYQDILDRTSYPNKSQYSRCKLGKKKCTQGPDGKLRWTIVDYPAFPAEELCGNDIDDNCNGKTEPVEQCKQCQPGQTAAAYPSGYSEANFLNLSYTSRSVCRIGTKICNSDGNWSAPDPTPSGPKSLAEMLCDGKDDNCDGQVDEGSKANLRSFYGAAQPENIILPFGYNCWDPSRKGVCKGIGYWAECKIDGSPDCKYTKVFVESEEWYTKPNEYVPAIFASSEYINHLRRAKWDYNCNDNIDYAACLSSTQSVCPSADIRVLSSSFNCGGCPSTMPCETCVAYSGSLSSDSCGASISVKSCSGTPGGCSMAIQTTSVTVVCH